MATTKLKLYNGALRMLEERKLADLTENVEARFVLDDIWDEEAIDYVLEQGQWNFAGRTVKLDFAPSITPSFGYQYGFAKPDDFIKTMQVCKDEYFALPITAYQDEARHIFCDPAEIYFQYVSNDAQWGTDYSLWPPSFTKWVQSWIALEAGPMLTNSATLVERVTDEEDRRRRRAKSQDAMESPAKFPPEGRWASWRRGSSHSERGRRTSLFG